MGQDTIFSFKTGTTQGERMDDKLNRLKKEIQKYHSAVIAFSGGVDSTFLARVAGEVLEKRVLLITASSSTYPQSEMEEAKALAISMGLPHRVIVSEETEIEGFTDNPPDRCYFCKRELFSKIKAIAEQEGFHVVFEGTNVDDQSDFRPGKKAVKELGIISPLNDAGLTKNEIREFSRRLGLSTAEKPSYACLASRFPYGEKITIPKLTRVGTAEQTLRALGFKQFRVRSHQDCARVEIASGELEKAWEKRNEISAACKKAGFVFVAIDLDGYRTGAMNETLTAASRKGR
jgi:pyridinium-3,5-biscarboxylic acid mononucleotide sulfurtransferase